MLGRRDIARVGMLAVGLGIAATPGVAVADSSSGPVSWLSGLGFPAADTTPTLDFQISIDGYDLVPAADTSGTATSGAGDIAFAFGSGNFAEAVGDNSDTFAGGIFVQGGTPYNDDIAYVLDPFGTEASNAFAGSPGGSDLAAVLFLDGVTANITGGNDMVEILPSLSTLF